MAVETIKKRIGTHDPLVSLVLAITEDFRDEVDNLEHYLVELDCPGLEIVAVVAKGETFHEGAMKNMGVKDTTCDYIVFTNAGVYPPLSLITKTRREIESDPYKFVMALRLDGTRDYGVFPNPYALGDWQGIHKNILNQIGGFEQDLHQAGYMEQALIGKAINGKMRIVIMDERVYHSWHPPRQDEQRYREMAEENRKLLLSKKIPIFSVAYPADCSLEIKEGMAISQGVTPQADSVLDAVIHAPHDVRWSRLVEHDKRRRA